MICSPLHRRALRRCGRARRRRPLVQVCQRSVRRAQLLFKHPAEEFGGHRLVAEPRALLRAGGRCEPNTHLRTPSSRPRVAHVPAFVREPTLPGICAQIQHQRLQ
jgi:hypothetical protein